VYFVVPESINDPELVSGGNVYDQRVRDGLRDGGSDVRMVLVPERADAQTARAWSQLPDGAVVLVDGLIAVRESEAIVVHSSRLRIVVLAHMVASAEIAASADRERLVLKAAKRVIATSQWTRSELIARNLATPESVIVAHPGTGPAEPTVASQSGGRMLCVGVLAPHKGQDLLIQALAHLTDVGRWTCTLVGSVNSAPNFVDELRETINRTNLTRRVTFTGALAGNSLERAYSQADLVVVPSRTESFGMVITEALAHGIPVVAARVGGIPEAMSTMGAGILVPPGDPWALEVVLRHWLTNREHRSELTAAAITGRTTGTQWATTVDTIAGVLQGVASSQRRVPA
jgi:glycosyltransferase involved in cell wall biosynthesis